VNCVEDNLIRKCAQSNLAEKNLSCVLGIDRSDRVRYEGMIGKLSTNDLFPFRLDLIGPNRNDTKERRKPLREGVSVFRSEGPEGEMNQTAREKSHTLDAC
jgi:hypothetical protein